MTSNMYNGVSPVSSYSSSRPSVIDNQQRDEASQFTNTAYYPSPKKMRLDNLGMPAHSFSQFSGVPAVQGLQSYIASELASAGGTRRVSQQTSSPSTVASEESRAEEKKDDAPKPKPRGPRLKLLKKRLEAEESDGSC